MTASRLAVLLVLVALAAVVIVNCGKSDADVVAKVGNEKITVRDFQEFLERNKVGFRSAQEEFDGKRMLLDSLISHNLLVQAAYAKHIDQSPEVARILEANRSRFLLDALYHTRIDNKINISEAELRQIYDDLQYQIRAYQILFDNMDTAQMVFEKIKAGANFEEMAYQYSLDERAKRDRGDMGYFLRGTGPEAFEKVVFRLDVGEITPPFETEYGIHIVKVVDKKPNDAREPFASLRPALYDQVLTAKRQELVTAFMDSIRTAYPVTVDTTVANYVTHKRMTLYPPEVVAKLSKSDFDDEQLDRDEKELVLGTWNGGQVTLIDYLLTVRRYLAPDSRPDFDDYDSLAKVIFEVKRPEILVSEAEKGKIAEGDFFKMRFKMFERYTIAEIMRNDSIPAPLPPSEQELRDYYDKNREKYLVPSQLHLYEILVSDQMLAQKLVREIRTLEEFQKKAAQYTERSSARVKQGDLGFIDSTRFPAAFAVCRRIPLNTIGGPIPERGMFSVVWPVQWTPETYGDFLNVKETIAESMATENKNRAINAWLKNLRDATDIEIYDDVIWSMIDKELYKTAGSTSTTP
jgi:peptidyl-prolyl cis-trans isomerase C